MQNHAALAQSPIIPEGRGRWFGYARAVAVASIAIVILAAALAGCSGGSSLAPKPTATPPPASPTPSPIAFVPNTFTFWDNPANFTTKYGPAYADILVAPTNFVPCLGGPFALCYYSGPDPLPCTPSADGRFADCQCYAMTYGQYYVDINAILNHGLYLKTVKACGKNGERCTQVNSAPICDDVNHDRVIPGADSVSTFSFDCVPTDGLGQTGCPANPYAGCMTAGCHADSALGTGFTDCQCPTFTGPYQLGVTVSPDQCTLGADQIWSAAYNVAEGTTIANTYTAAASSVASGSSEDAKAIPGQTHPVPPACVPDAPQGQGGCPLFVSGQTLPPDSGVDCTKVCQEYDSCLTAGTQVGYTCDSTLCTRDCSTRDLVGEACPGLSTCDISEIVKAESAAQCSCCASQLCNCNPSTATNNRIYTLDADQRTAGVPPQCDINGTLCGTPPAVARR